MSVSALAPSGAPLARWRPMIRSCSPSGVPSQAVVSVRIVRITW